MNAFLTAVREVWGLFVEDATFTLGIIVCLIAASYVLPHVPVPTSWRGPLFFLMLAIVLIENVVRSARR
jgi:hypothetical protein